MSSAHLSNGRVGVGQLRELARRDLLDLLDKYSGSKALVWDESLTGPLGLIAEYSVLKEHEVTKMFPLKPGRLPPCNVENVVFLVRPHLASMDTLADNIKQEERGGGSGTKKEFHIVFVPRKSLLCEKRLKDAGVFGSLTFLDQLTVNLFPLDSDLLSMELPTSFRDYHLEGDPTCLHNAARAMMTLQAVAGVVPRVYGKGKAAAQMFDLMSRMRREMSAAEPAVKPQIDTLVILDRSVDLLSPLATQLTYEGLIDEIFSINQTTVRLPAQKFTRQDSPDNPGEMPADTKQFTLSSAEDLYAEIRGFNFNAVGPTLSRKARNISAQFEERHEAKTVREIKQFVDRLPHMQAAKLSLATHTSVAELIKEKIDSEEFLECLELEQEIFSYVNTDRYIEAIEDLACRELDFVRLLRLLCMQSLVNSGLKPKLLDMYRKLLLQVYGHNHVSTLDNLEKVGLLSLPTNNRTYSVLRKRLNLVLDSVDEQRPTDIAYVHSVYAPLSVRLVQQLEKPGWRNIRDVLDLLPGPSFEDTQQISPSVRGSGRQPGQPKVVLVFFVGGCTFAEVAALRFLSQQEESNVEYLVATTSIINGSSFLESLTTKLEAPVF